MTAFSPCDAGSVAPTDVVIRLARSGDAPALAAIANWAVTNTAANFRTVEESAHEFERRVLGRAAGHAVLTAERDGRVVGFAAASPFHDGCGLAAVAEVSVYVHPDHVGRRVGSALYGALIQTLRERGFRTLVAMIALPNDPSERLHARFGFVRAGCLIGIGSKFGQWHDLALWQLTLGEDR
jgi:phosphinothricin acetyltransferase